MLAREPLGQQLHVDGGVLRLGQTGDAAEAFGEFGVATVDQVEQLVRLSDSRRPAPAPPPSGQDAVEKGRQARDASARLAAEPVRHLSRPLRARSSRAPLERRANAGDGP
ncbi:MAG: hypothetical protein MUC64_19300 [Rubritepida sp.]|nr:hypothetical protein [Rubritepida sp.]